MEEQNGIPIPNPEATDDLVITTSSPVAETAPSASDPVQLGETHDQPEAIRRGTLDIDEDEPETAAAASTESTTSVSENKNDNDISSLIDSQLSSLETEVEDLEKKIEDAKKIIAENEPLLAEKKKDLEAGNAARDLAKSNPAAAAFLLRAGSQGNTEPTNAVSSMENKTPTAPKNEPLGFAYPKAA